jgi:poly [ADP-ribose] polymerase
MPPKKATASLPLAGYTIALSGTFAGTNQTAVQRTISSLGANVAKSLTADTNVLVSTTADVKKGSKKVQDASASDIPVVSLDWLDECASSLKAADPMDYLLSNATTASVPSPAANGNRKGKKRAASPDLAPPPAQKAAKVVPLASAPKLEPKVGEGSVLKSRNVNIPLDEGCPLQAYRVHVDEDGIVYDASLNQTNASHNNNKFYRVQVRYPTRAVVRRRANQRSFSIIPRHVTIRLGPAGAG